MVTTSNEWQQIYHNNLTGPPIPTVLRWSSGDLTTEATTVTSTTTTLTTATSFSNHLSRVARPSNTRRRSRVSRRTPTTLLNTDTTNFRAMVQQFTGGNNGGGGGGSAAFMASTATVNAPRLQPLSSSYNSSNISSGSSNYYGGTGSTISPPAAGGYNVEFRQPQNHQYYSAVGAGAGDQEYHQHGFVKEGGANISGDPIHGHNNTAFKF